MKNLLYKLPNRRLLPFIDNTNLYAQVEKVLEVAHNPKHKVDIYRNTIDPFSAVFDGLSQGITMEDWLVQEKLRQAQKTMQNALGNFHQEILGSVSGWESLGIGYVVDLRNTEKRIIAEIKNKYNTTDAY